MKDSYKLQLTLSILTAIFSIAVFAYTVSSIYKLNSEPTFSVAFNPNSQLAQVVSSLDTDPALVGWWKFDEGIGTTAADSSSNAITGTFVGSPAWLTGSSAKVGNGALSFNGSNSALSTQNTTLLGSGALTVCAWINPSAWTDPQGLHVIMSDAKFYFAAYKAGSTSYLYFTSDNVSKALSSANSISLNQWQHVCAVRDATGIANLYVNGAQSGAANQNSGAPTPSGGWAVVIGAGAPKNGYFFNGAIDDLRVYSRVLGANEISQLYSPGNTTTSAGSGTSTTTTTTTVTTIVNGRTLTVAKSGSGSGTVTAAGINCGNDCSEVYADGTWVVLTPVAASGSSFAKWPSGTCDVLTSDGVCTVIMRSDLTVVPIFGVNPTRSGTTDNAASCEMSDVQVAVNLAQDGDTIKVPAGTCTWKTTVEMGQYSHATGLNTSKSLNLIGAGADSTTIIDNIVPITAYVTPCLSIYIQSGKFVRVSGFTFDGIGSARGYGAITISGPRGTGEVLFRVDHNKFPNMTQKGIGVTSAYGLIDSNTFIPLYPNTTNGDSITGDDYDYRTSNLSWSRPQQLGSDKAVYMENNNFLNSVTANGAFDAYDGARYVFRYNNVVGTHVGHHGFDSGTRGVVDFEIYNNTFSNPSTAVHPQPPLLAMEFRSGSGVIFNNFVAPPIGNPNLSGYVAFAYLRNYRSSDFFRTTQIVPDFTCDGSSSWDGNSPDLLDLNGNGKLDPGDKTSGYPCKDQMGRTGGIDAKGYQPLSPVYGWNNNFNGVVGGNLQVSDYALPNRASTQHILEGRDYFNGIPKPGYSPYACPHPLTGLSGKCDPNIAGTAGYNLGSVSAPVNVPNSDVTVVHNNPVNNNPNPQNNTPNNPSPNNPAQNPANPALPNNQVPNINCPAILHCTPIASSTPSTSLGTPNGASRLASTFRFSRSLSLGQSNISVKSLQIFLNDRGFTVTATIPGHTPAAGSFGHESNYFGPATKRALIKFQEYYKADILAPVHLTKGSGYFGPSSIKKVNGLISSNK